MIFKFILSSSSCKSCQIFIGIGRTEQPWANAELVEYLLFYFFL